MTTPIDVALAVEVKDKDEHREVWAAESIQRTTDLVRACCLKVVIIRWNRKNRSNFSYPSGLI